MQYHAESLGCHGVEMQCTIPGNANVLIRTDAPTVMPTMQHRSLTKSPQQLLYWNFFEWRTSVLPTQAFASKFHRAILDLPDALTESQRNEQSKAASLQEMVLRGIPHLGLSQAYSIFLICFTHIITCNAAVLG